MLGAELLPWVQRVAVVLLCPEHPLPPRTAHSWRVERLLTSHVSELFPRTTGFCFDIFKSLGWVRVSLSACPLRVMSVQAAAQPRILSREVKSVGSAEGSNLPSCRWERCSCARC